MIGTELQDQVLNSSFLHLVQQASIPAKIVLAILLFSSIASWAIIFRKYRLISEARRQSLDFLKMFRHCTHWAEAHAFCEQFSKSPIVRLFLAAYDPLITAPHTSEGQHEVGSPPQLVSIERELQRATMVEVDSLETHLNWLASIATAAPFIGLFGTVVGIIISFQGLSLQTQTSIQAVAPGIAEALIATAAGLFVAVPAYVGYNYFVAQVRWMSGLLDEFSLEVLNAIDGSLTEYGVFKP